MKRLQNLAKLSGENNRLLTTIEANGATMVFVWIVGHFTASTRSRHSIIKINPPL
ncbi:MULTISPECIES: hypothetical protein [Cyanophyceae]|uniref:hypothetical protein n=1 Tax=Cyanophyceae TaxID=3028117 RepID=UPI001688A005|nr:hypothetical protein [Trichocoleus sp. FACHB-40]MBD2003929.1 hypothetical protein [Trichocoleus sp. FACHB-40]